MSNIGCKIINDFNRIEPNLINKFGEFPVANVGDCMNRLAALDASLRPINQAKLIGTAFTVKVPEGDNLMFHKAMDLAQPGDIILIDAGGYMNRAILGELMVNYCISKGINGIVVDGCVRDYDVLSKMDFPIYAKGTTPNGPYKNGPGEINVPISIGGKVVNPGDIVLGDADGIIVIDPQDAEKLLKKTQEVSDAEIRIIDTIYKKGTYERPWVDEKLKELGCEISTK